MLGMSKKKITTTTYKDWLEPEKLLVIRNWRRHGLTVEEVANNIGVARQTLQRWSKDYQDIYDALKTGKEEAVALVENKLFLKAMSGNLTAIIFWLKNNARETYNDSRLSPEEIKQAKARTRMMIAEASKMDEETRKLKLENDCLSGDDSAASSTTIIDDIGGMADANDKDE